MRAPPVLFVLLVVAGCGRALPVRGPVEGHLDAGQPDAGGVDAGAFDGGGHCETLGVEACRADPACEAHFCRDCGCSPGFKACLPVGAPPPECPMLKCLALECCRQEADCQGPGAVCLTPGSPPLCGTCFTFPGDCAQDADCDPAGTGRICEPVQCSCSGAKACVPGCSATSPCARGEACSATTRRCEPVACSPTVPCPPTLACDGARCSAPRPCSTDAACGDGFCVKGQCRESLGVCSPLPP